MKRFISMGLAIFILVSVYYLVANVEDNYEDWSVFSSTQINFAGGTVEKFNSNIFSVVNTGDNVELKLKFPIEKKRDDTTLFFFAYHSVINVYFEDKVIYSYGQKIADSGRMIGSKYVLLDIPEEVWGSELTISFDIYEEGAFSKIAPLKLYASVDAYKSLLYSNVFSYLIAVAGIIFSILGLFIFSFLSKSNLNTKRGMYIMSFIFLASLWLFAEQGIFTLFHNAYIWTQIEYMALYALPIPLLLYMYDTENNEKQKKILYVFTIGNIGFFIITSVLHISTCIHYSAILSILHIVLVLDCIVFLMAILTGFKKKSEQSKSLMMGFLFLFIFAILDIFRFNFHKYAMSYIPIMNISFMPIGFFLFITFLIVAYYKESLNSFIDQKAKENLMKLAYVDAVTNSMTRKAGVMLLEEKFKQFQKINDELKSPIIMMLDIDNFKKLNDTYGHDFGDYVLNKVAQTIKDEIRKSDSLIRWGGEEFVLIYNNANINEQYKLGQNILRAVSSAEFEKNDVKIHLTISIGGTIFKNEDESYNNALKRADIALYHSKEEGKNRYFSYEDLVEFNV